MKFLNQCIGRRSLAQNRFPIRAVAWICHFPLGLTGQREDVKRIQANPTKGIKTQIVSLRPNLTALCFQITRSSIVASLLVCRVCIKNDNWALAECQAVSHDAILGQLDKVAVGTGFKSTFAIIVQVHASLKLALVRAGLVGQFSSLLRALRNLLAVQSIVFVAPVVSAVSSKSVSFLAKLGLILLRGIAHQSATVVMGGIGIDHRQQETEAARAVTLERIGPMLLISLISLTAILQHLQEFLGGTQLRSISTWGDGSLLFAFFTLWFVVLSTYLMLLPRYK